MQKLGISEITKVSEIEPAIFEVTTKLIDGSIVILRMNAFVANTLASALNSGY
jgi:hypothetical protein